LQEKYEFLDEIENLVKAKAVQAMFSDSGSQSLFSTVESPAPVIRPAPTKTNGVREEVIGPTQPDKP
jgi:hypothetical protein